MYLIEEAARKEKQLQEEQKQRELLARKRKLAFDRNRICQDYCSEELAREDWNKDYVDYLQSQFINVGTQKRSTSREWKDRCKLRSSMRGKSLIQCERVKRSEHKGSEVCGEAVRKSRYCVL